MTQVSAVCRACFRANVTLDLSTNVEAYGPEKGTALSVLLVHGGGSCRSMYRHLAHFLVANSDGKIRCVLMDLPGHGGRMDEPATIENCVAAVKQVIDTEAVPTHSGIPPVYLGGSFGGYVGMKFVATYPAAVSGVILACCAQNTGIGSSLKARMAMNIMEFMSQHVISASQMVSGMMRMAVSHKHLDLVDVAEGAQTGWYFHQSVAFAKLLKSATLVECMRAYHNAAPYGGRVLYTNGADDHRDTLTALLDLAPNPQAASSILYEHTDHFFSHDERVRERFEKDVLNFCVESISSRTADNVTH